MFHWQRTIMGKWCATTVDTKKRLQKNAYESMRAHKKVTKAQAKDRAMELFEKLNFKDSQRVWDSYPFELSGGMNQRAGIAIAMLMNPPVLFADEPTSALDVSVQRQVVNEMLNLRELFGTSIVIVTHDIGVVRAMADSVLVLKNGKTVEYGEAKMILLMKKFRQQVIPLSVNLQKQS